jgi:L-ascorbate metabolism protein UlaG (beta-lactamase superfamily)
MNIGGSYTFPFGKVKYVSAIHSSVLPDGTYGGNPGGFVLSLDDREIYYAGDTALTYDMKLIRKAFNIDLAFLPIGDNFTMGVDDAVIAAKYVGASNIVGMHYNTFPPIEIDTESAIATFDAVDKKLTLIQIGDSIEI